MTICSSVKSRGRYMAHVFKHEARKSDDPAKSLRKELNDIESRINEMMLAADMNDPAPTLREVQAVHGEFLLSLETAGTSPVRLELLILSLK